jgi:hypothetical protein
MVSVLAKVLFLFWYNKKEKHSQTEDCLFVACELNQSINTGGRMAVTS